MSDIDETLQQRGGVYGDFGDQSEISQALKQIVRSGRSWGEMAPFQQEGLDMIANKIARIVNGDPSFYDSWHDIEGYARLVADKVAP